MFWVMKLAMILLIGGIIGFILTCCINISAKMTKRLLLVFGVAAALGLILEMVWLFALDDTEYDSDGGDDYKYSPQYYEDAYEYYKDNDNWNRDYGDKYGYR